MLAVLCLTATCGSIATDRVFVERTGPDELLKLRAGPSLQFNVILGLPDGTALNQKSCVTELGQRWCLVSLADAPGISGYVSADYLSGG
ncbi:SH3 domain-containing protein [Sulfitobacter sp. HNIBRBA3233]|uniref:SH3 domain-containing protein n=1 Tax=Sulfitobacter marinivivus TaxID=3158558 RepID=UPI0032DE4BB2